MPVPASTATRRFVPIKHVEQQVVLSLHRVRQGFVKVRTVQANQIRGLLSKFGLIIPVGIAHVITRIPSLLEESADRLPASFRRLVHRMMDHPLCDEVGSPGQ